MRLPLKRPLQKELDQLDKKLGPWKKKNEEAEPLLRSASSQHYIAKAMLAAAIA